jgi:hypothetical protein
MIKRCFYLFLFIFASSFDSTAENRQTAGIMSRETVQKRGQQASRRVSFHQRNGRYVFIPAGTHETNGKRMTSPPEYFFMRTMAKIFSLLFICRQSLNVNF